MTKKTMILTALVGTLTAGVVWASNTGLGLPRPTNDPVSIREKSARAGNTRGPRFVPYFIGGGIHHGK